jgi:hypothetical protein
MLEEWSDWVFSASGKIPLTLLWPVLPKNNVTNSSAQPRALARPMHSSHFTITVAQQLYDVATGIRLEDAKVEMRPNASAQP